MKVHFLGLMGLVLSVAFSAEAAEFVDEIDRDFPIRSIGHLNISNLRGSVSIQGWSQDRIRVKARRRVIADTPQEADRLRAALDFRYQHVGKDIELSAEYGRGMSLGDRLKERENQTSEMEIFVQAPANLPLRVWTTEGAANVQNWNSEIEVRTAGGRISVEEVRSESISLMCPLCAIRVKNVKASVRVMGGAGDVELEELNGKKIYVETDAGGLRADRVRGEQLFVTKTGNFRGKALSGRIEFSSKKGNVEISSSEGFLSGRTESGNIDAQMLSWKFLDKALIETIGGNISLALPAGFSGELDVWSLHGKAVLGFPVRKILNKKQVGPEPLNRIQCLVGHGGELLKVFSEKGAVSLVKLGEVR